VLLEKIESKLYQNVLVKKDTMTIHILRLTVFLVHMDVLLVLIAIIAQLVTVIKISKLIKCQDYANVKMDTLDIVQ